MPETAHKSGFVSIVGRPNTGKSTLLNALVGTRLAIVSDKPQTTRTNIQGVITLPDAQIVFVDTPGIHKADSLFNRRMIGNIREALHERDVLVFMVDATRPVSREDEHAVDMIRKASCPVVLALNKIDRVSNKSLLLPLIERYRALFDFAEYVPISAATGEGVDSMRRVIIGRLPEGPPFFPSDHLTDQPERFLAAELIREKVLELTRQEVPHSTAVMVDQWQEQTSLTRISAAIYVERDTQKGIIIGAGGQMLKTIGTEARQSIESLLGRKVFLELFVKVESRWRDNAAFLKELDWRTMAGKESD